MTTDGLDAVRDLYAARPEGLRLASAGGTLEFERTKEIVTRSLPTPPATIADIGGGTGAYSLWLAGQGYTVVHRDLIPGHVEQLSRAISSTMNIETMVGDARALDLEDNSADGALVLGPLYHLERRSDRILALREAARVVRPGSPVFVAAVSRWMQRIFGNLARGLAEAHPSLEVRTDSWERTGWIPPLPGLPGWFSCYTHRPRQLRAELTAAGLEVVSVVAIEGPAVLLADLEARMQARASREVVLSTARALESVPELTGVSPHLLAIGRSPGV